MKKIIVITFVVVLCCFCWHNQAIAACPKPLKNEKEEKFEISVVEIRQELDRLIQEEEPGIDTDSHDYRLKRKRLFEDVYLDHDTVGSQRLFERALCSQLQQAVWDVLEENSTDRMALYVFEKNGNRYCCLIPAIAVVGSGDGYLLYQNKVLVEIFYDSKALATLVMKPDELKELPYIRFLPVLSEIIIEYDGSSDYYRIIGRDSLEFIGRLDYWEKLSIDLQRIMYKR